MAPAVRAEILVFWRRSGEPVDCATATKSPDTIAQERERYGFVHELAGVTAPR
jgi:hypothetical protein